MQWEYKLARQGWADGLIELGTKNKKVVVLDADLAKSTLTCLFKEKFPDRFFDVGIAEQNLLNVAGGLSLAGFIPFVCTYGVFVAGRAWEQIRTSICYGRLNVKIGGAHCGISVGPDGATHQALEEIATMRVLPNMTVIAPADYYEAKKAVIQSIEINSPVYIRFGREKSPVITDENSYFKIGEANILKEGKDITFIACGQMVPECLLAAETLEKEGIFAEVINMHTIKPLDEKAILKSVKKTGCVVTAEEHQIYGGLGGAVAEFLGKTNPVPLDIIGVRDSFGESGKPEELMEKYGLLAHHIVDAARGVLKRK